MPAQDENWLQRLFAPIEEFFRQLEEAVQPSPELAESLGQVDAWIWGLFLIFLLVGTGLFFAWRTRFVQLRKLGCDHLISGTFEHWHKSVNLHRKAGFRIKRKFIKRRVLRILPCPPKKIDYT